jgi:ubiquinone/menaquinone biosynthesis C-methylase UbiE
MPDPDAFIAQADEALQARLADVLELRASDPQQRAMIDPCLSELELPNNARALEVGCGTGAVTRILATMPGIRKVVGIDPSSVFVERARVLGGGLSQLSFETGDARALAFADASFDLVVFHTTLCHLPDPEQALREAHRVLRAIGRLAIFEGDYLTTTVAIQSADPLQRAVDAMVANFVHNPWFTRRLAKTLQSIGFRIESLRSHGYTQTAEPTYMLTLVDRGAEALVAAGTIEMGEGEALKAEARRRAKAGEFFGHISYLSFVASKES